MGPSIVMMRWALVLGRGPHQGIACIERPEYAVLFGVPIGGDTYNT
jgi:hypothetical protein